MTCLSKLNFAVFAERNFSKRVVRLRFSRGCWGRIGERFGRRSSGLGPLQKRNPRRLTLLANETGGIDSMLANPLLENFAGDRSEFGAGWNAGKVFRKRFGDRVRCIADRTLGMHAGMLIRDSKRASATLARGIDRHVGVNGYADGCLSGCR